MFISTFTDWEFCSVCGEISNAERKRPDIRHD